MCLKPCVHCVYSSCFWNRPGQKVMTSSKGQSKHGEKLNPVNIFRCKARIATSNNKIKLVVNLRMRFCHFSIFSVQDNSYTKLHRHEFIDKCLIVFVNNSVRIPSVLNWYTFPLLHPFMFQYPHTLNFAHNSESWHAYYRSILHTTDRQWFKQLLFNRSSYSQYLLTYRQISIYLLSPVMWK